MLDISACDLKTVRVALPDSVTPPPLNYPTTCQRYKWTSTAGKFKIQRRSFFSELLSRTSLLQLLQIYITVKLIKILPLLVLTIE